MRELSDVRVVVLEPAGESSDVRVLIRAMYQRWRQVEPHFNDQFGNIEWTDVDRVRNLITEDIPARVAADTAYQNAQRIAIGRRRVSSTTRRWNA
ncbi:MAG: hypothetical protein ABI882_02635 [Acidobacteriota bacterium]